MEKEIKGIYPKLAHIQSQIRALGKDKDTKSTYNPNGYKYLTGDKLYGVVRPLMDKLGVILKTEVLDIVNVPVIVTTKAGDKTEQLTTIKMKMTWVDTESGETDVNFWGANGCNGIDKGFGSAVTYGHRYFVMKYFCISTDEDDVDGLLTQADSTTPQAVKPQPNAKQIASLIAKAKTDGVDKTIEVAKQHFTLTEEIIKQING